MRNLYMSNKKNICPDISLGIETLKKYIEDKASLVIRINDERLLWSRKYSSGNDESSAWLFNSVINKHADVIDNMPVCVCLPREKDDAREAEA